MKKHLIFTAASILLFTVQIAAQVSIVKKSDSPSLESLVDNIFKDFDDPEKPGASVAVLKEGEIIFKKGYGSANLEYGIPVKPNTVFHVASVSKQFTVFSILLLQDQGKLSLDDDIRKHIPEVPDFGATITLRHLASHTSGMRDQWALLQLAGWRMDDVITKDHIMTLLEHQKELNFQPGEEYMYCNSGYTLLAEVVSRTTGLSFGEFTHKKIFAPLEMNSTLFFEDHQRIVKNRAYSYHGDGSGYKKSRLNFANAGATSLFTTVEDLALWANNFENVKVGSQAIIDQMNELAVLNNGETFGGAYGQFVGTYKGHREIQHGGADAGYRSYLTRFPDDDLAVMVFSNLASSNPGGLAHEVADLYLEDNSSEEEEREKPTYKSLSVEHLKQFEGNYWSDEGALARKIYVENDTLRYFRSQDRISPLVPIGFNKFEMMDVPVFVTVEFKKEDGSRSMTVVQGNGSEYNFEEYKPVENSSFNFAQYVGTYFSEELMTEYELEYKNGKLYLSHFRIGELPLELLKEDLLGSPGGQAHIVRDENGQVSGFHVFTGRIRNLWFEKK